MTTSMRADAPEDLQAQGSPTLISEREHDQIERANASKATPVVFIHGLWVLPSSWDRFAAVFEEAGYVPLTPSWPATFGKLRSVSSPRLTRLTTYSRPVESRRPFLTRVSRCTAPRKPETLP